MRIGVIGLSRGLHVAGWARRLGMEVVAACDRDGVRREAAGPELPGVVLTEHWEELLEHRLDGVVLANGFDEHASLAIAFLDRGVHVLSECAACVSEDEGRRLVAAAEAGELGRISLIEADYLHGMSPDAVTGLIGDPGSRRSRIAATAFCTHTVSPVLAVTVAWPVEVAAFPAERPTRATPLS